MHDKFDEIRRKYNLHHRVKKAFIEHPISLMMQKAGYLRQDVRSSLKIGEVVCLPGCRFT